ncbi:unnamed protein product [Mortierella alpina]
MVPHHNSRRPRLVLLLGTALYLQGAILPTTLAAKAHLDPASDVAQTHHLVKSDPKLQQSQQQHISNLQQDSQTVAAVHKSKGKNKGDKKAARETVAAVDAKGTKAHNHSKNKDQDEVKGSDGDSDSDSDNDDDDEESRGDDSPKNDVNSYLADLWKGIVHLGEEPNIQAGIAALTSGIHGVTKHHGKRDVIQQQQQRMREGEHGTQSEGDHPPSVTSAIKSRLLQPHRSRIQKILKKKTAKMHAEGDDVEHDQGGLTQMNLPKVGQRVVFGKGGQVVGLAVEVGPGHPTGHGVSEAERFVKYGNEIMRAGEIMLAGHDLTEVMTPAPHPFLVLEKRQRLGILGAEAPRGDAGATMGTVKETQPLEMDIGLKRAKPVQEPEMDRAMDNLLDGELQKKSKKEREQEADAVVQDYEKIAKKLKKQNDDALQAFPTVERKEKKDDPLQKAFDKMFGGDDAKGRKKDQADPFEVDAPKRHKNKNKGGDWLDSVPIEVQKEKKDKHEDKSDKHDGDGEPAHKDPGPSNGDMGKPTNQDAGKTQQEPSAGPVLDPGKGAGPNQVSHPPDRTGPAPVTGSGNKKDSSTPGGFGTVPMFGPAQLDLGSGATVSTVLSTWTCAFAVAAALIVTLVNG